MLELNENDVAVHFCTFQAFLEKAKVNLRFPSLFFVEWKTINNKNAVGMIGRKRAINSIIDLNENLIFTTEMLYHRVQKQYLKKQSLFHLNLISNSRPDQIKLVGRVVVDLAEIANTNRYASITTNKLLYCSVDAQLSFSLKMTRNIDSNLQLCELDKSSFNDLYSFTTPLRNVAKNKFEIKDSVSDRRIEEQRKKIKAKLAEQGVTASRSSRRQLKTENILIKDLHQQTIQQKSIPQSLPLTQKKPQQKLLQNDEVKITFGQKILNNLEQHQKNVQFQDLINKQKNILQKQLNQHKKKIKKLEEDVKDTMKLFQKSVQDSEINKSKLIQSEEVINGLKVNEGKLQQFFEKQLTKVNQQHQRDLQVLKLGYQADLKILRGTIQQLRLRAQDYQVNQKLMQQYQQILQQNQGLKQKLKAQEDLIIEFKDTKNQILTLNSQKQSIFIDLQQKKNEFQLLRQEKDKLKSQYEESVRYHQNQLSRIRQQLRIEQEKQINIHKNEINNIQNYFASKISQLESKQINYIEQIKKLTNQIQSKDIQYKQIINQNDKNIFKITNSYQSKLKDLSLTLQNTQKQLDHLKQVSKQIVPQVSLIDLQNLQNYQKLKDEHLKLTHQLQTLRKSILFPQDYKRTLQDQNNQLFVILQKSQLQDIEISQLKHQNAAIKEKMDQLLLQHENLKTFTNKQQQQRLKLDFQLQTEQLNLIKEELNSCKQQLNQQILNKQKLINQLQKYSNGEKFQEVSQAQRLQSQLESSKLQTSQLRQQLKLFQLMIPKNQKKEQILENNLNSIEQQYNELVSNENKNELVDINDSSPGKISYDVQQYHQEHQRHNFNFQQHGTPLTNEQLNKMLEVKDINNEEMQYLNEEILKLKQEIEQLKNAKCYQRSQSDLINLQNTHTLDQFYKLQDNYKKLQSLNQDLKLQIAGLRQQVFLMKASQQQKQSKFKAQQQRLRYMQAENQNYSSYIHEIEGKLSDITKKNQQLLISVKNPPENVDFYQKQNTLFKDLENRLANLEQEVKIKDQLLAESQKNIEQNYAIKYELADLKDKYSEVKGALQEREEMIAYLEQTKEQLSKQLEQIAEKSRYSGLQMQTRQIMIQTPKNEIDYGKLEAQNGDLRNENESLRRELISINNNYTQLRSKMQDCSNQGLIAEKDHQQSIIKLEQKIIQNNQLNNKIEGNQSEIISLREQINSINLKNNELLLQIQNNTNQKQQINRKLLQLQANNIELKKELQGRNIGEYSNLQQQIQFLNESLKNYENEQKKLYEQIHQLQAKFELLGQQNAKKEQLIINLRAELSSSLQHIQQLQEQNKKIFEKMSSEQINSDYPQIAIHEIDSINEVIPIQYQKSTIPLFQRSQLQRQKYNNISITNKQIEELNIQIQRLKNQLSLQSQQKYIYLNELQTSKNKILQLQIQIISIKQQLQKYNSLPIQSFNYMNTPIKNHIKNQSIPKNIKQPSILHNNKKQISQLSDIINPPENKTDLDKNIETNVQTKVQLKAIHQSQLELLQKQLEILQQQLESEQKLHNELQEIHKICDKKYEILNSQAQNSLLQLQQIKQQNQQLKKLRQDMTNELYYIKDVLSNLQIQHQNLQKQYNILIRSKNNEINQRQNILSIDERRQYEQKLNLSIKNQQKLNNKILLLQQNILNLQNNFQQHIQISQANDKITQKLQQLNQLQNMAVGIQQELQDAKNQKLQLIQLKQQNQQLQNEKIQLLKSLNQHQNCVQQRAEWQQKLQKIQNILLNNENKFAEQKQELQNKVMILNQQKANLQAQKSHIVQNIKKQNSIVDFEHIIQQLKNKQSQLYFQLQSLRTQKLAEMQKVAELEEQINNNMQAHNKKVAELQETYIIKQQEYQQIKFINIQLNQQLQETKGLTAQYQLQKINLKQKTNKLQQQNISLIQKLQTINQNLSKKQEIIHNLQQSLKLLEQYKVKTGELQNCRVEISTLKDELSLQKTHNQSISQKLRGVIQQSNIIKNQLEQNILSLKQNKQKIIQLNEQILKVTNYNSQLQSQKNRIDQQLKKTNMRYQQLQSALKNNGKMGEMKDKNLIVLKGEINKKDQQLLNLAQSIKAKQKDILNLSRQVSNLKSQNNKYQFKIQQLIDKERLMKQTFTLIQRQSNSLVQNMKINHEKCEGYYKKLVEKQRESNKLGLAAAQARQQVNNIQRLLTYQQQKVSQLANQVQILKKNTEQSGEAKNGKMIEYQIYEKLLQKNEQLLQKNREYLEIISQKTSNGIQNQKLKRQVKQLSQKIVENDHTSQQLKKKMQGIIPELQRELQRLKLQNRQLNEKNSLLNEQIQNIRQINLQNNHKVIENLILQKDKQINNLKKDIKNGKQSEKTSNIFQTIQDSNISILNQQILNLNREILQKDSQLNKIKNEMKKVKELQIVHQVPQHNIAFDQQKQKLLNQLHQRQRRQIQYQENIKKLSQQLKNERSFVQRSPKTSIQPANIQRINVISNELYHLCGQIKQLCNKRSSSEQSDRIFQTFVQKYDLMEQQFNSLNLQTSLIQEKAKFISKQLQKIKSFVIKSASKSYKQKTQLLGLIKPCQNAASELVNISQTLSEKQSPNFL